MIINNLEFISYIAVCFLIRLKKPSLKSESLGYSVIYTVEEMLHSLLSKAYVMSVGLGGVAPQPHVLLHLHSRRHLRRSSSFVQRTLALPLPLHRLK